jgi:hypothetical protein
MESHGDDDDYAGWVITPDSSTRAHWQSYQQRHLGASRRNGRRNKNFQYSISEIPQGIFNMP